MQLGNHPNDVPTANPRDVPIACRGHGGTALRCEPQCRKTQENRCQQQPREHPATTETGLEKPLNHSTLVSHDTHLILSRITVAWAERALPNPAPWPRPLFLLCLCPCSLRSPLPQPSSFPARPVARLTA